MERIEEVTVPANATAEQLKESRRKDIYSIQDHLRVMLGITKGPEDLLLHMHTIREIVERRISGYADHMDIHVFVNDNNGHLILSFTVYNTKEEWDMYRGYDLTEIWCQGRIE